MEESYSDGRRRYRVRSNQGKVSGIHIMPLLYTIITLFSKITNQTKPFSPPLHIIKKVTKRAKYNNGSHIQYASKEVKFQFTAALIHWMIRMNNFNYMCFSILLYIFFSFIFALIIMAVATIEPKCVTSSTFEGSGSSFISRLNEAWSLSWTTFSTVGYGVISPSTAGRFINDGHLERFDKSLNCAAMSFTLSFESLAGILFVSFAGAIIYVKLIQFQSHAQVKFSSIMVVKYGSGVEEDDIDDDSSYDSDNGDLNERLAQQNKIPCPVLVFRLVNLLNTAQKGEIVNASINTVATIDIKNAIMRFLTRGNTVFKNALNTGNAVKVYKGNRVYHRERGKENHGSIRTVATSTSTSTANSSHHSDRMTSRRKIGKFLPSTYSWSRSDVTDRGLTKHEKRTQQLRSSMIHFGISSEQLELTDDEILQEFSKHEEEDEEFLSQSVRPAVPIAGLGETFVIHNETQVETPNLVFTKVEMDPKRHPYFLTSWRLQHTLNHLSPLLTKEARKKITQADGYWPNDMNNAYDVQRSIDFDQILISFQGISKATGNHVYGHQVYTKEDLRVGYQFKSILVHNFKGSIPVVEPDFIDDIKDQNGGRS